SGHGLACSLHGFFCAEFARASGCGSGGADVLGAACLCSRTAGKSGGLVFAGGSGKGNGDSDAPCADRMGDPCAGVRARVEPCTRQIRAALAGAPASCLVRVSTWWRRGAAWRWVIVIVGLAFGAAWFVNPPYGFSPEDNLAYRDYILLHQKAEKFLEARYPMARVMTAWPASDELSRPYLGYVTRPMQVLRIENFSAEQLMATADLRSRFDLALVFSTKYEPPHVLLEHWRLWLELKKRFFDYHLDLPPDIAAQILGGQVIYSETRKGQ